jgi:hypothetical protein
MTCASRRGATGSAPSVRRATQWPVVSVLLVDVFDDATVVAVRARQRQHLPRTPHFVALMPQHVGAGVELGNAQLRMGHREAARKAYQGLLDQKVLPVDDLTRAGLQRQIARLDAGEAPEEVEALRHSWME